MREKREGEEKTDRIKEGQQRKKKEHRENL